MITITLTARTAAAITAMTLTAATLLAAAVPASAADGFEPVAATATPAPANDATAQYLADNLDFVNRAPDAQARAGRQAGHEAMVAYFAEHPLVTGGPFGSLTAQMAQADIVALAAENAYYREHPAELVWTFVPAPKVTVDVVRTLSVGIMDWERTTLPDYSTKESVKVRVKGDAYTVVSCGSGGCSVLLPLKAKGPKPGSRATITIGGRSYPSYVERAKTSRVAHGVYPAKYVIRSVTS